MSDRKIPPEIEEAARAEYERVPLYRLADLPEGARNLFRLDAFISAWNNAEQLKRE